MSPEAKAWLPARKPLPEEYLALGKGNKAKIAKLAKRHAQDDIKSRSNPNLSTPLPSLGDAANVARLTTWRTLSDAYEDAKMDDIADQIEAVGGTFWHVLRHRKDPGRTDRIYAGW